MLSVSDQKSVCTGVGAAMLFLSAHYVDGLPSHNNVCACRATTELTLTHTDVLGTICSQQPDSCNMCVARQGLLAIQKPAQ